jgi:hypothetical protein
LGGLSSLLIDFLAITVSPDPGLDTWSVHHFVASCPVPTLIELRSLLKFR